MGLNPNQDCRHCDKCDKVLDITNQSGIRILCIKCEKDWHKFFEANVTAIEDEFRVSQKGSPNPTWYVFLNKLPSKYSPKNQIVKFIFR